MELTIIIVAIMLLILMLFLIATTIIIFIKELIDTKEKYQQLIKIIKEKGAQDEPSTNKK